MKEETEQIKEEPQRSTVIPKIILIDDDPIYGEMLAGVAKRRGMDIKYYTSLIELESFSKIGEFDLAIIDVNLGASNGYEVAEYIDMFLEGVPVVIISGDKETYQRAVKFTKCIKLFIPKEMGPDKVLSSVESVLMRRKQQAKKSLSYH